MIGALGAGVAAAGTLKMVLILQKTTGKSFLTVLKGLSRQERKRLTEEIIRANEGKVADRVLQKLFTLKKRPPWRLENKAIQHGIRKQLMDAVGASLNVAGSATSGLINQAASSREGDDYIVGLVSAYQVE